MKLLMGLNESFAQVQGQILLRDPLPSLNKVYSLLIQEEKQRSIALETPMDLLLSLLLLLQRSILDLDLSQMVVTRIRTDVCIVCPLEKQH